MKSTDRVALFINGKTFHAPWCDSAIHERIDFPAMASWIVGKAGGKTLAGAHYFTDIDNDQEQIPESASSKVRGFLEMLARQPGCFAHVAPCKISAVLCKHCGREHTFASDKEVDLAMAAQAMYLAGINDFGTAVLVTGDGDYAPVARELRTMGKRVYVAAWGLVGVSRRLQAETFSFIDLSTGMHAFSREDADGAGEILPFTGQQRFDAFLSQIVAASRKFQGGFIGVEYFLAQWRSPDLDDSVDQRHGVLSELLMENWVETYTADNGDLAVRLSERGMERLGELGDTCDQRARPRRHLIRA